MNDPPFPNEKSSQRFTAGCKQYNSTLCTGCQQEIARSMFPASPAFAGFAKHEISDFFVRLCYNIQEMYFASKGIKIRFKFCEKAHAFGPESSCWARTIFPTFSSRQRTIFPTFSITNFRAGFCFRAMRRRFFHSFPCAQRRNVSCAMPSCRAASRELICSSRHWVLK